MINAQLNQISLFDVPGRLKPELNFCFDKKQILYDLFQAYYDARKNKRNTINAIAFEVNYESNLFSLYDEIINRRYAIKPSICFISFKPVQREIFAADFRDRIIHHLVFNYINPIFDPLFIYDSYSCRKGKGTLTGIRRLEYFIRSCSDNYKKDCYILKMDIKGYFMSMNRTLLFNKIQTALQNYYGKYTNLHFLHEFVLYLLRKIIFNDPTRNCVMKGQSSDWEGLPPTKSLFHAAPDCGFPIGNLTSQLFSNIYLNEFDQYIKHKLKIKYYGRYVDDFVLIHQDKEYLKSLIPFLSNYLLSTFKLTLHPKKIYLQHYSNGVEFLGAVIKPYRTYIKNRTKGNLIKCINTTNRRVISVIKSSVSDNVIKSFLSSINSYLGLMIHYNSFRLRKQILTKKLSVYLWNYFYISNKYSKLVRRKI